jgi:hypothetical protein
MTRYVVVVVVVVVEEEEDKIRRRTGPEDPQVEWKCSSFFNLGARWGGLYSRERDPVLIV